MLIFQEKQLFLLYQKINKMLDMLNRDDAFLTAKFKSALQRISNNIEQCITHNFDGIQELGAYVLEDWRIVCVGKDGAQNWYLNISDIELKEEWNKSFDEIALSVENILNTNFLVPRKWYSYSELIELNQEYESIKDDWEKIILGLIDMQKYYQSLLKQIPNDIWSFAKMLCLRETDEDLKKWFLMDIPAFGYISPLQIIQIKNGENILRVLLYNIPV